MALATQCPHCQTTFKVAHDQLKLRAGLVRCGACKQIFNGIEHLLRPDEWGLPAAAPSPAPAAETGPTVKQAYAPDAKKSGPAPAEPPSPLLIKPTAEAVGSDKTREPDAKRELPSSEPFPAADDNAEVDPLQRMTLIDFTYPEQEPENDAAAEKPKTEPRANAPDPLDEVIEALQRKPLRGAKKPARKERSDEDESQRKEFEEPSFVKQGRRRQRIGRALRILMGVGSLVLLVGLLAQGAYVFRNELAARFPQAREALAEACLMTGCQVSLPAQIEAVAIESSELQAVAPGKNVFALTILLRNHGALEQTWPNIELTLNDADEKAIVRRVFTPRDYLASAQGLTGFAPKSEQPVKLFFELSQVKASGYRVYLFYP